MRDVGERLSEPSISVCCFFAKKGNPALIRIPIPVSRRFSPSPFPLRKPLEDLVHLMSRKSLECLLPDVPRHTHGQRQAADGFVIGGIAYQHEIVSRHGPEELLDLYPLLLLRHLLETLRAFGCFLYIPDPLVRPIDQPDVGRHRSSPFHNFPMRGWLAFRHQRSVPGFLLYQTILTILGPKARRSIRCTITVIW